MERERVRRADFLQQTGRQRNSSRSQIGTFGRSEAAKATWIVKKEKALDIERKNAYNQAIEDARAQIAAMPKKINAGNQNKHIRGSSGYIEGRSYIYGGLEDAQALVYRYSGTGTPRVTDGNKWTHKEFTVADAPIGVVVDNATGEEIITRRFSIHYGKHGAHIVPAKEEM